MTATANITKIAKTTLLCAGLIGANGVWSKDCPEGPGAASATHPDASQTQALSVVTETQPGTLSGADRYEMFHDAVLNKPDGLGDYVQNFRAAYPH